jgi:hypothetical protein
MVELIGVDALMRQLADYPDIAAEEYEAAAQEGMDFLRSPLREYGPETPTQTYVRKYILQEGWDEATMTFVARADGFDATMGNPTMYGPYVQGDPDMEPHQALAFVDRWKPTSTILTDNESAVVAKFDAATERIVKRLGG